MAVKYLSTVLADFTKLGADTPRFFRLQTDEFYRTLTWMAKTTHKKPADYISPLYMNGLRGRMLRLPAPKNHHKEILFIYGHHSSLERWWGVVQDLNQYGAVTMPDLPGFGGMDSFYKIGEKPTLDALADYLASFIKLRYKNRRITVAGLSFGFAIITRMLQRYPELADKVDLLISVVGFAHKDDFSFSRRRYLAYLWAARFFSYAPTALFFRNVCLHPWVLRAAYGRTHNAKSKFENVPKEDLRQIMDFEIYLWHCNDVRTYMRTTVEFFTLDNCKAQIDLPVWHVSVKADKYFDNQVVEQHMRIIFTDFHDVPSKMDNHAPSIIADKKTAAPLFPAKIRQLLKQA